MPRFARGSLEHGIYRDLQAMAQTDKMLYGPDKGLSKRRNSSQSRAHRLEAAIGKQSSMPMEDVASLLWKRNMLTHCKMLELVASSVRGLPSADAQTFADEAHDLALVLEQMAEEMRKMTDLPPM